MYKKNFIYANIKLFFFTKNILTATNKTQIRLL